MNVHVSGRGWAYVGAILGGAVSIAANVAHSYVPPAGASTHWTPPAGAVVGAIFWPVALFVAVEILARVAWPAGRRWAVLRFGGLVPVALVAAFVSYKHLAGLLAFYGEDPLTATLGPLAVDGLMVMATAAMIATSAQRSAVGTQPASTPDDDLRGRDDHADPWQFSTPLNRGDDTTDDAPTVAETATVGPDTDRRNDGASDATKRVRPTPPSAVKVAKAAARMPGATAAAIAAKAGVSESTARRYLPATVTPPTEPPPAQTRVNGHTPELTGAEL